MHNIQKEVIFIKRKNKVIKRILYSLLGVVLVALICAATVSGAFVYYMKNIDASLDIKTLASGLGLTTKIYYTNKSGNEEELLRLHGNENRIWANSEDISQNVKNAFIAIEDHRFYEHNGIDPKRLLGAVLSFFGGKSYGGSTITQQLIKNLTGENQVTVKRKLTEIMRALELEKTVSKDDILEMYLNNVYLSSGCFGVETAAERFFGKSACDLSLAEAATLAAIVQNPSYYDPIKKQENNKERKDTVLFRMHELGFINEEEYLASIAEEPIIIKQKAQSSDEEIYSWFVDAVIEDVISELSEKCGFSREQASAKVYSGGLSIHTTLDKSMQDMIENFYAEAKNFPHNEEGTPDSAAVIIDGKTGAVRAISGGRGKKSSNRAFCLATKARRSPGSALKPISVYAPAIEKDLITWATVFDDVPVSITKNGSLFSLWPKNNPRVYSGLTTVNKAIMNSVNTVAVRVLNKVGLERSFDFCKKLGISGLVESSKGENGAILSDMIENFYAEAKNFPHNEEGTPDSAAVIIDGKTGAVRAISGGRGKKSSNRAFCLATKARRSPGSALKPISVYAPAIEKDLITWATVFDDVPVSITKNGSLFSLWPKNNPRVYSGLTTVNKAIMNSVNTVAVRVLNKVGLERSFDFCKKLGISGLVESSKGENGAILSDIAAAPLALGATSVGVTVRDMTGAYTVFTRGGEFEKPYTFTAVYDNDGTLLLSHGENAERIISTESADIMTRLLKNVVTKGTAKGLRLATIVEVAGKTGTSNSGGDRWFIGCTPDYVCGVWSGYRDGRDIGHYEKNPACTVFDGIMSKVYDSFEGYTKKFSTSDNVIGCAYCVDSGHVAAKACHRDPRGNRIETGYFKRGTEPHAKCDTHIFVKYDKVTRAVACDKCPPENIIDIALLKVARSFPCEVKITDSQYTYRYLPLGTEPALEEDMPFFARLRTKDEFFGTSGASKAYNRYCKEHFSITEQTEEVPPAATEKTEATVPPNTTSETTYFPDE